MKSAQESVQAVLDHAVAEGKEIGLQVAVYHEGKLIVDAFAGIADLHAQRRVDAKTLFPVFSTTKGFLATLAHRAVQKGKISYETRLAEVWPEFAAHGKEKITLRHALSHTAGVPLLPAQLDLNLLCDWDAMCAVMADLKPVSPPGMEMTYHPITYAWTVGEAVRRVEGRSIPDLFREEICAPLGLDSVFVGLPDNEVSRVALLVGDPAHPPQVLENFQAVPYTMQPLHEWMNRPEGRRACVPSANGIMNARSIARHYAALLPGGVDGIELLSPDILRQATEPQTLDHKRGEKPPTFHSGTPSRYQGLGYLLGGLSSPAAFGHDGYGGSIAFADPKHRIAFAFARNRFSSAETGREVIRALGVALNLPLVTA